MCVCVFLLLALAGHAGVLYGGRDLGPELLLAGLGAAQGGEQALELVLTAGCPHEGLQQYTVQGRVAEPEPVESKLF